MWIQNIPWVKTIGAIFQKQHRLSLLSLFESARYDMEWWNDGRCSSECTTAYQVALQSHSLRDSLPKLSAMLRAWTWRAMLLLLKYGRPIWKPFLVFLQLLLRPTGDANFRAEARCRNCVSTLAPCMIRDCSFPYCARRWKADCAQVESLMRGRNGFFLFRWLQCNLCFGYALSLWLRIIVWSSVGWSICESRHRRLLDLLI